MNGAHVSLFAGIGGIDLAAKRLGFHTVLTAEKDDYCQQVLAKRFLGPRHLGLHLTDVRAVKPVTLTTRFGTVPRPLLVSGGFPCQDISNLGARAGMFGFRSGPLWDQMKRVIVELDPEYVLVENVSVLRNRGLDQVLWDLYEAGYDARWDCIPAAAFGAPHIRDRIFVQAWRQDQLRVGGDTPDSVPVTMVGKYARSGYMTDGMVVQEPPHFTVATSRAYAKLYVDRMWPTPRSSANEWRTTKNAPSHGNGHGRTLAGEVNDAERAAGFTPGTPSDSAGNLNPEWVEWLMGFPMGWTDLDKVPGATTREWDREPRIPRTCSDVPHRRARLCALGNACVPGVAEFALKELLQIKRRL